MASNPPSFFDEALTAIDTAGAALQAKLDELWVPFDPATGTGGLHWHDSASKQIIVALQSLAATEDAIKAVNWPVPVEAETPAEDAAEPVEEPAAPVVDPPVETPPTPAEEPAPDTTSTTEAPAPPPVVETTPEEAPPAEAPAEAPAPEAVPEPVTEAPTDPAEGSEPAPDNPSA